MILHYAQIVAVFSKDGLAMGRVRVGGALTTVPLNLVADAVPGDTILVCDGVGVGRVSDAQDPKDNHVSGNSR